MFGVFGSGVWGAEVFDHGQMVTYVRANDVEVEGPRYRAIENTTRQSRPE